MPIYVITGNIGAGKTTLTTELSKKFKGKFLFGEADVVLEKELIEVEKI